MDGGDRDAPSGVLSDSCLFLILLNETHEHTTVYFTAVLRDWYMIYVSDEGSDQELALPPDLEWLEELSV